MEYQGVPAPNSLPAPAGFPPRPWSCGPDFNRRNDLCATPPGTVANNFLALAEYLHVSYDVRGEGSDNTAGAQDSSGGFV